MGYTRKEAGLVWLGLGVIELAVAAFLVFYGPSTCGIVSCGGPGWSGFVLFGMPGQIAVAVGLLYVVLDREFRLGRELMQRQVPGASPTFEPSLAREFK